MVESAPVVPTLAVMIIIFDFVFVLIFYSLIASVFSSLKPKPERKPKLSSAAILVRLRLITNGSQNYGGAIDDKSKFAYVAQNYPGITSCGIKCHSSSEISLLKECLYIRTLSTTGVAIYLSYSFARNLRSCP